MKPTRFCLLVTALILSFVLCSSPASFGNSYTKGRYSCDFERVKQLYKVDPKDIDRGIAYAGCLLLRAQGNDIAEGMRSLYHKIERHNHIFAALLIAEFIESGGDFQIPIDENKINEAIHAYFRVLAYINRDPRYPHSKPISYIVYEKKNHMELRAHYHIPYLYLNKFVLGFHGLYHEHLLTSPGYKGKRDLPRFHKYSSYTRDSLEKTIQHANRCINLPKKWYFSSKHYEYYRKQCRLIKEAAIAIQPLEEKRLVLLATESCRRDLPKCREYNELHKRMKNVIKQYSSESSELSRAYDIALL